VLHLPSLHLLSPLPSLPSPPSLHCLRLYLFAWSKSLAIVRQADSDLGVRLPRPCHVHRLRLGRVTAIGMTMVLSVPERK
jgi:hypothetical protein